MKHMKQLTFKMPNSLICDNKLSYSARKVGAVLYAHHNALGTCHKSYADIARLAAISPATARKAVGELRAAKYIATGKTYCYNKSKGTVVYGKTAYACNLNYHGGYTLIPRDIFHQQLSLSAFAVLLSIYMSAGNTRRAFPSISKLMATIGAARSTVCCAIRCIKALPMILVQLCRKANHAFTSSSYHLVYVSMHANHCKPVSVASMPRQKRSIHDLIISTAKRICNNFFHLKVVRKLANYY